MKGIRILMFLLCIYIAVPYDLYVHPHYRIYYYGTDVFHHRVQISPSPDANYTLNLMNCKVHFRADSQNTNSFYFEFGFEFGTNFSYTTSELDITASPSQTCIVNMYMPPSG